MKIRELKKYVLYVGLALLLTHELDAVKNQEWLVLPLISWLDSAMAYEVFLWLHVPIYFLILALLATSSQKVRSLTATMIAAFLVLHAGLHSFFSDHKYYQFNSVSSDVLIYAGALFGLLYLSLDFITRNEHE